MSDDELDHVVDIRDIVDAIDEEEAVVMGGIDGQAT
ncbi:unnamed protein product, partial [Protopolystoma xenopodis]